jgi:hypothetical protein
LGRSEQKDDPDELRIQEEIKQYGDILRLDMVDTYADLSLKTLKMFSILPQKYDADFYFKIDDDVAVNIDAMANYLNAKRNQGNLYLVSGFCSPICPVILATQMGFCRGLTKTGYCLLQGCMKSGQVLTDRRYKWFEPEYWRFGDPASAEGQINYMRHASGQVLLLLKGLLAMWVSRSSTLRPSMPHVPPACLCLAQLTCRKATAWSSCKGFYLC